MIQRLVTFLGTTNYTETKYFLGDQEAKTRFVCHALAQFLVPTEILVFATDEAWAKHGVSLTQTLDDSRLVVPHRIPVGLGQTTAELWKQFKSLLEAFEFDGPVAFDITHSFRSQPFFASAGIQFFQSVSEIAPELNVYYGAFEARDEASNRTPIWDLSAFVELLHWSRAVLLFLRTGRADDVAEPTRRLGRELQKQWAMAGKQGQQPSLEQLGKALQRFGDDFVTLRTGALISNQPSSARQLLDAIEHARPDVVKQLPPLASVLDEVVAVVRPLVESSRLSEPGGQRALQALARRYFDMGRYAETAATLREGWITRFACARSDMPGAAGFSNEHREAAENAWFRADPKLAMTLGDIRNDIEHAGFNAAPKPPETIKRQLDEWVGHWCDAESVSVERTPTPIARASANTVFYSIGVAEPVTPETPLPDVPKIPRGALVVIEGRAPIWRYGLAFHRLHGSPAGAIAVYDPRLGAVVVASHHPDWREGDVVDVAPPADAGPAS